MQQTELNKKGKLIIFGTGGLARLACAYFQQDSLYEVAAFTVHRKYLREDSVIGLDVIPFEEIEGSHAPGEVDLFVSIGYERVNEARADVYRECKAKGYRLAQYVSSKTTVWSELELGDNSLIAENNSILPFVKIGSNVIVGSGNHIGHDTVVGDHCFIAGHAMIPGYVTIGDYSFIGGNATIKDGINVAPRTVIGAGAVVTKDTQAGEMYIAASTKGATLPRAVVEHLMRSPFFREQEGES